MKGDISFKSLQGEAREEFLVNIWSFTYWGIIGSFIPTIILFLKYGIEGYEEYALYPLIGFPIAGVVSTIIIVKKSLKMLGNNPLSIFVSILWGVASLNIVILSFGYPILYGKLLIPTIFFVLGFSQLLCGWLLRLKSLLYAAIVMILMVWGFGFYLQWSDAPFVDAELILLIILSVVGQLIPGVVEQSKSDKKKKAKI